MCSGAQTGADCCVWYRQQASSYEGMCEECGNRAGLKRKRDDEQDEQVNKRDKDGDGQNQRGKWVRIEAGRK